MGENRLACLRKVDFFILFVSNKRSWKTEKKVTTDKITNFIGDLT